jgi:hypothetical protein
MMSAPKKIVKNLFFTMYYIERKKIMFQHFSSVKSKNGYVPLVNGYVPLVNGYVNIYV